MGIYILETEINSSQKLTKASVTLEENLLTEGVEGVSYIAPMG